ncbi:MAG: hypothetical protein ACXABY_26440 [Candidatus Thorarchaeota archaeon]|jgi:hypothetical protein
MADEAQIIYEYTNGNDVSIKTNDLKITYKRHLVRRTQRPDGKIYVDDPGIEQRIFTGTGVISGADQNEMNTVQMAAITFDGSFPRIKKIYFAGAVTITNVVIELTAFEANDLGSGFWEVSFEMQEYTG